MTYALEMMKVVKTYRSFRALDGLDLRVPTGSIFGLVGSNGAGKTTSLVAAAGLLRIHSGNINILDDGPFSPHRHRGRVSLLPQDAHSPPHARLEDLLHYYGRLQGMDHTSVRRDIFRVLDMVHLSDRRRDRVRTLSHGMRRRLTIAQAFLGEPELVLLDEPLNGLDPREVANLRTVLRNCAGKQTLVVSSHLLTELEAICDHVAIIEKGQLIRQDELHAITRNDRQLVYRLEPGDLPLQALRAALPSADIEPSIDRTLLTVRLPSGDDAISLSSLNALVLPILLHARLGILEVHRGSDLEQEYLAHP